MEKNIDYYGAVVKRSFILLLSISVIIISGCSENTVTEQKEYSGGYMETTGELAPSELLQIRKDYQQFLLDCHGEQYSDEFTLENIWIQYYFGNYSGCEAVYMGSSLQYNGITRHVEIGPYVIVFPTGQEVYIYKNSMFYTVLEAFESEIISKEDVYEIGKQAGVSLEEIPRP